MSKKTKVFESQFKGHPILEIWPLDENGNTEKYKTIGFGVKKAKAILENMQEIQAFVDKHESGDSNEGTPTVTAQPKPEVRSVEDVF